MPVLAPTGPRVLLKPVSNRVIARKLNREQKFFFFGSVTLTLRRNSMEISLRIAVHVLLYSKRTLARGSACYAGWYNETAGAIHSTKISGNFGPKLNGSVRSNRKSFEKTGPPFEVVLFSRSDWYEFWLNGSRPVMSYGIFSCLLSRLVIGCLEVFAKKVFAWRDVWYNRKGEKIV